MRPCVTFIILSVALLLTTSGFSQDIKTSLPVYNPVMQQQADSIKKILEADGFTLLRENTLTMESQYDAPIYLALNEGNWYQLVFIGENTSRLYEVRMYDMDEKQVIFEQRKWADIDGNVISYSYIPKFSEWHLLRMVQVNKHKNNLAGHAMIFKKTAVPEVDNLLSNDTLSFLWSKKK